MRPHVGYYVHHRGLGHLHRALVLAAEMERRGVRVTVLSSLPPTEDGRPWLHLPADDDGTPDDVSPGGWLHWAPRRHDGLRSRTAAVSRWIEQEQPDLVVSDVSQEIALLCRLHGVPVISVVLPGHRGDRPHLLGLGVSERLVGFWPSEADAMVSGLTAELSDRLTAVGALSRYPPTSAARPRGRCLVVLSGRGGGTWDEDDLAVLRRLSDWQVCVLGGDRWTDDPWPHLRRADVVLTRAGQVSIAEVAASRTPAIVVAAPRPHDEQAHTAAQLRAGPWPTSVPDTLAAADVGGLVEDTAALDGSTWSSWCDGRAAARFGELVAETL